MRKHVTPEEAAGELFVVIASDGIWDCWRYEEFGQFLNEQTRKKSIPIAEAGEIVLNESVTRAVTNFGAKHYDDASVVTWRIGGNERFPIPEGGENVPPDSAPSSGSSGHE